MLVNIVNHFALSRSAYTCEQLQAYKSLDSYKLFVSGWVRDIKSYRPDGCQNSVISAKVSDSKKYSDCTPFPSPSPH